MIKNKKGSIIYISSSSALDGNSGRSAYSSSKSALLTQAKTLSNELGVYNIRVNTICPGGVHDENNPVQNKNFWENYCYKTPLNRMGKPEEIATAALFLCSPASSYVTGEVLVVDGGYTTR